MARWVPMPPMSSWAGARVGAVAVAVQGLWPRHLGDGRYRAAPDSHSAHPMVLGCVLGDDTDAGLVGAPAPAAIGHPSVRDSLDDAAQAPRGHGAPRP